MEPASLATGVAGLAGLLDTCLQLYDTVDAGKKHGADYEILTIKLGIERVRLVSWGEKVGLVPLSTAGESGSTTTRHDPRLDDQRICAAVWDILGCMKMLFEETDVLQGKYGLREYNPSSNVVTMNPRQRPNNVLAETFKDVYHRLQASTDRQPSLQSRVRWAIGAKKRFAEFVEDVRGFNNSLDALLPHVAANSRANICDAISSSTNSANLRVIEQATSGLHDDLSDVASMRLTQLTRPVQDDGQSTLGASILSTASSRFDRLLERSSILDILGKQVEGKINGVLEVSISKSANQCWGNVTWVGVAVDEYLYQRDYGMGFVKYPCVAWSLHYATCTGEDAGTDYSRLDPEASDKYNGGLPGTTTVHGFAGEFTKWAEENEPAKSQAIVVSTATSPVIPLIKIYRRLRELQDFQRLPWNMTDQRAWDELKEFLGHQNSTPSRHDMRSQASHISRWLNRGDLFHDFRTIGCVGLIMFNEEYYNDLWQILLAYELRLRRKIGWTCSPTPRVTVAMEIAERWQQGVRLEIEEGSTVAHTHSLVHERQVEGLIRFAEELSWPHLAEVRDNVESAYVRLRSGTKLKLALRDWLFGIVLPGREFSCAIMSALVVSTSSLEITPKNLHPTFSFVLADQSYWRSTDVVGRVLGATKGVRSIVGWVGPCNPVSNQRIRGWVCVSARSVGFSMPEGFHNLREYDVDEEGNLAPAAGYPLLGEKRSAWIKSLVDRRSWRFPPEPPRTPHSCVLQGLYLHALPGQETANGLSCSTAVTYRASLDITIDGAELVQFTLYSNPVFIAAHHCLNGPHMVYEKELSDFRNICDVKDLKKRNPCPRRKRVLVINATCDGGELVARAWCAENGQHAVVVRRPNTQVCFRCAVDMAGNEGLGVYCLIWA